MRPPTQFPLVDAGIVDAPPDSPVDLALIRVAPPECALSDCYRIFADPRGLVALDGESCCFEANCTSITPARRAWVVSCHGGTVHTTEVIPIND